MSNTQKQTDAQNEHAAATAAYKNALKAATTPAILAPRRNGPSGELIGLAREILAAPDGYDAELIQNIRECLDEHGSAEALQLLVDKAHGLATDPNSLLYRKIDHTIDSAKDQLLTAISNGTDPATAVNAFTLECVRLWNDIPDKATGLSPREAADPAVRARAILDDKKSTLDDRSRRALAFALEKGATNLAVLVDCAEHGTELCTEDVNLPAGASDDDDNDKYDDHELTERAKAIIADPETRVGNRTYLLGMIENAQWPQLKMMLEGIARTNRHLIDQAIFESEASTLTPDEIEAHCEDIASQFDPEYDGGPLLALLEHLKGASRNAAIATGQIEEIQTWLIAYSAGARSKSVETLADAARTRICVDLEECDRKAVKQ